MTHTDSVLVSPIETEKTVATPGKVVFRVHNDANKEDVGKAIEKFYGLKTVKVNIVRLPQKTKQHGRRIVRKRASYKKAIVTLEEGKTLNFNDFK